MSNNFQMLSDAEHIRKRFAMYGGSKDLQSEEIFIDGEFQQVQIVAGLLKVINEIVDNSIDEYVRTKGQAANLIKVTMKNNVITVEDNGRGIPNVKVDTPAGVKWQAEAAFTHARAGSNFNDETRESIGMNGVGSMITFVTSESFEVKNYNDGTCVHLRSKKNIVKDVTETPTTLSGVYVRFKPDYEFFGLEGLDETHIKVIENRLMSLAVAFPDITFKFNNKTIKTNFKKFFGDCHIFKTEKAEFGVRKSEGQFSTFSIINGLQVKSGSHIDYFTSAIVQELRELIRKRRKVDISAAKLKQHLTIFSTINGFKALKFDSQTKERVTNSIAECKDAIGEFDTEAIAKKLMKDNELINEIVAYLELQQKLNESKDLKKLEKKKKIKSDKYFQAVGETERIFVVEGDSASGGLIKCLGRKGNAFYALKGLPLNVLQISHQKFMANKELSELFQIITTYPDAEICIATDADADGNRITGLIALFVHKYFPEHVANGKLKVLNTPLAVGRKGTEVKEWAYSFAEVNKISSNLSITYVKGLGSLNPQDLQKVIETDTLDKMLPTFEVDNEQLLHNWFANETSDFRKERILEAEPFNIEKI